MIFRGNAEAIECFNKNGYTLFDTLTYSNKHVPFINEVLNFNFKWNFMCFRHKDIVDFFKLLRIRLQRRHKENGTIKYLYTGEYGTDQGCTHRPHIHVIFYYTGKLKPEELSKLVSKCWKYGRTDGLPYKSLQYVLNKRVFRCENSYNRNQISYICKYLQKESTYQNIINDRCNFLIKRRFHIKGFNEIGKLQYSQRLECYKLLNCIRQFSRISDNFGASAKIEWEKVDNGDTMINIPDIKKVVRQIPIPKYYIRKRYQNLVYYNIGNEMFSKWVWNNLGEKFINSKRKFNVKLARTKIINMCALLNIKSPFDVNELAMYQCNRGCLTTNNFKSLINYNLPKYKEMYSEDLQLADRPIYENNCKLLSFNDLHYIFVKDYEYFLNNLMAKKTDIGIKRHAHYLECKRLENFYKSVGFS